MLKLTTFILTTGLAISITTGATVASPGTSEEHGKAKAEKTEQATAPEKTETAVEGMLLPFMSPAKGRMLFASKGCVVCHSINGVGDGHASPLDAATMPAIMDPFDFAAKMWRGAGTMITLQEDELGEQIEFTGEELANIIAFVHSASEQKKFSKADIPERIAKLMHHSDDESNEGEHDEEKSKD